MKTEINPNSEVNQRICRQLVDREIIHCVSSMVSHFASNTEALSGSDYSDEDVYNLLTRPGDPKEAITESGYEFMETSDGDTYVVADDAAESINNMNDFDPDEFDSLDDAKDDLITDGEYVSDVDDDDELRQVCDNLGIDLCDFESEVYEHWAVTSWFANKLAEHGEVTGELFDFHIWGRCTTGRSISMDSVIQEIAAEMEILEGQKNDWSKS